MSSFGQKLRYIRKTKGLSQEQLGERLQTTKQVISRYESGSRLPKIDFVSKLGNVLNVPFSFILNDSIDFVKWADECYVDYLQSNSDEEKIKMVNEWGLDVRIASDYADIIKRNNYEECSPTMPFSNITNDFLENNSGLSNDERKLIASYRELNEEGQEKTLVYAEDLVSSGRYKKYDRCKMVEDA